MAGCELDFSSLPILTGCPGDSETFLVGNAVGGLDVNGMPTTGYARRLWSDMRICAAKSIKQVFLDFVIGKEGSPMNAGDSILIVTQANVIQDSVWISFDAQELPRNDNTQISYQLVYNGSTGFTVTFNQAVNNQQQYIIHFLYAS